MAPHVLVLIYIASDGIAAHVDVFIVKIGGKKESWYYVPTTSKSRSSTGTPPLYD